MVTALTHNRIHYPKRKFIAVLCVMVTRVKTHNRSKTTGLYKVGERCMLKLLSISLLLRRLNLWKVWTKLGTGPNFKPWCHIRLALPPHNAFAPGLALGALCCIIIPGMDEKFHNHETEAGEGDRTNSTVHRKFLS